MAEPNPEPNVHGTQSALEQLRSMMKVPLKTSNDFSATTSHMSSHPNTSFRSNPSASFRPIAAAPSTGDPTQAVNLANLAKNSKARKRKADTEAGEGAVVKKKRGPKVRNDAAEVKTKGGKNAATAMVKLKGKKKAGIPTLPAELWVRIAEFCAPKDLVKLKLVCKPINSALNRWDNQVRQVQVLEFFPAEMPQTFAGLSKQQYNNLLGSGRGCMTPGCKDKKAHKTYWPWARRWCWNCYTSKIAKWRDVKSNYLCRGPHEWVDLELVLSCLPFGICDSFGKAHQTMIDVLPNHAPKLYRVCESDAAAKIIQSFIDFVPKPIDRDPSLTDAENAAAMLADKQMRDERKQARDVHFKALLEENKKYMADVVKIEECILQTKKAAKLENAANRAARNTYFRAKAVEEFPDTPIDKILELKCYKDAARIPKGKTERTWEILKPKIEKKLSGEAASTPSSSAPTRSSSISTPSSTPGPSTATPSSAGDMPNDRIFQRNDSTPSSMNLSSAEISRSSTPSRSMASHGLAQYDGLYEHLDMLPSPIGNESSTENSRPSTPSPFITTHDGLYQRPHMLPFDIRSSAESSRPSTLSTSLISHGFVQRHGPYQNSAMVPRPFGNVSNGIGGGAMNTLRSTQGSFTPYMPTPQHPCLFTLFGQSPQSNSHQAQPNNFRSLCHCPLHLGFPHLNNCPLNTANQSS